MLHHSFRPGRVRRYPLWVAGVATAALIFVTGGAQAQRAADLELLRDTAPPPPPLAPDATLSIQLSPTPVWISSDASRVSTGGALADVDGDQDLDFVVSNGNDMAVQPQTMYRNLGGVLELSPSWVSTDAQYSGHCAVGDVTGDGNPDLVVANYGSFAPQRLIMYRNLGAAFETTASWQSSDLDNSFSCALGDVDLDGDMDLAVANGEAYVTGPAANDLYRNEAGALTPLPVWQSSEIESSYDVAWADVDRDGDLDLAVINSMTPARLYDNQGGVLSTTAIWSSTIAEDGNTLAFGDVDGDGWLDLAVATNRQIGGTGRFRLFLNQNGTLSSTPSWTSNVGNVYGSAVAFADLDADGDEDLVAGSWWGQLLVFENLGGTLTTGAAFISQTTSVIEAIIPGDVDGDGLVPRNDVLAADGSRRLFYVSRRPIQRLVEVRADGVALAPGTFACDLDQGWISVAAAPAQDLAVDYWVSDDLDLAVTNWDSNIGNYVFENQRATTAVTATGGAVSIPGLRISPLPARSGSWVTIQGAAAGTELRVISAGGRVLARILPGGDGVARYRPSSPGVVWVAGPAGDAARVVVTR